MPLKITIRKCDGDRLIFSTDGLPYNWAQSASVYGKICAVDSRGTIYYYSADRVNITTHRWRLEN